MNNPPVPYDDASTKPIPQALALSARELLIRTGELPQTKRELLVVLSEYRATVHALVAATGHGLLCGLSADRPGPAGQGWDGP